MERHVLRTQIYQNLQDLSSEEGFLTSGKEEVYSCLFGRDFFKSSLKIMKAADNLQLSPDYGVSISDDTSLNMESLLTVCRRGLLTHASLQATETNIENGAEPGKTVHEYRPTNYERLLTLDAKPWFIDPDGKLRNYDSIDSTPLFLLAVYKYWQVTGDNEFLLSILPNVEAGLNWCITYGDGDKDQLLEYELPKDRKYGGLAVQSWTDSPESIQDSRGNFPLYPIAPVEVQGYAWLALKQWSDFYSDESLTVSHTDSFAHKLDRQARVMKERFNEMFIFQENGLSYAAQALDGAKNQIRTVTANPLLLLWATYQNEGKRESILDDDYIHDFVNRGFLPDMFDSEAGIRTMSTMSPTFISTQDNYHNGSFWPFLNGMIHEGLMTWGYTDQAEKLKDATLKPIMHFGSPIELYVKDETEKYLLYKNPRGQESCRVQLWSAAAALDLLTL